VEERVEERVEVWVEVWVEEREEGGGGAAYT
jgi:hypothetical protein